MADFQSSITNLAANIPERIGLAKTEEATKISCVNPFLRALGYDTEDLTEVVPEHTADVRGGNSEKVDYAIILNGQPIMLLECKAANTNLSPSHRGQLRSYFVSMVEARIGVLTNGAVYEFFTDVDIENMMDDTPFWTIDLRDELDDDKITTLNHFTKNVFDVDAIKNIAEELKYVDAMKATLQKQLQGPGDELVRLLAPPHARLEKFRPYAKRAIEEIFRGVRESMIAGAPSIFTAVESSEPEQTRRAGVETTDEEREAFEIVKTVLQDTIDGTRLSMNDTLYYCGIIVDSNTRQTICRLRFGARVKNIGLFGNEGNENRNNRLASLSDINDYAEQLRSRASLFA